MLTQKIHISQVVKCPPIVMPMDEISYKQDGKIIRAEVVGVCSDGINLIVN